MKKTIFFSRSWRDRVWVCTRRAQQSVSSFSWKTLLILLSDPLVALFVSVLAFGAAFSKRHESDSAVWVCIVLAFVFFNVVLFNRYGNRLRIWISILILDAIIAPLCGLWLTSPELKTAFFADDSNIGPVEQYRIRREITLFSNYIKDVGFSVSSFPLAISRDNRYPGGVISSAGPSEYSWTLRIGRDDIDWSSVVGYSHLLFVNHFVSQASAQKAPDMTFRLALTGTLAEYFAYSYSGRKNMLISPGTPALKEIRLRFGQKFTDRCLYMAVQVFDSSQGHPVSQTDFDKEFEAFFLRGEEILDSNSTKRPSLDQIFKSRKTRWADSN